MELGRLEKVDLRSIWVNEAGNFTPWLAEEGNLGLLGDTVGMELELEAQEKDVGPFRADILCKDTATSDWVLIENQLEKTDHSHLGQLITYAAGLHAVTIVWIAARLTDEHRAALDWLNEITSDEFNFFGLEIELWQIGSSPVAPKFNVVCKPNDWTKSITKAASQEVLTDIKRLQLAYWSDFAELLLENNGRIKPTKPLPQHWMNFSVGRSNFTLQTFANTRDRMISVGLFVLGSDAKPHFHLLHEERETIEREIGESLEWRLLPEKKESQIMLRWRDEDPADRGRWPAQHEWLLEKLEAFHESLAPKIKTLDAGNYAPEENGGFEGP